jgi:hypothetical protein
MLSFYFYACLEGRSVVESAYADCLADVDKEANAV